jgi:hypothetical protein
MYSGIRIDGYLFTSAYIPRVRRCPYFPGRINSPKCSTAVPTGVSGFPVRPTTGVARWGEPGQLGAHGPGHAGAWRGGVCGVAAVAGEGVETVS